MASAAPVLVVSGPTGVGKSTVSALFTEGFERSAHVRADDFARFVVNGWVVPWTPEAHHQSEVLGRAMLSAALQFAVGGYAVALDGHFFPDALGSMAEVCGTRGVALHYVALRADLATCLARATARADGAPPEMEPLSRLHDRFADLGAYERHAVLADGEPQHVADRVRDAFAAGALLVPA